MDTFRIAEASVPGEEEICTLSPDGRRVRQGCDQL
jgi:hypothetical protein